MGNPKYLTIKQHAVNYSQSKEEKKSKSENILAANWNLRRFVRGAFNRLLNWEVIASTALYTDDTFTLKSKGSLGVYTPVDDEIVNISGLTK